MIVYQIFQDFLSQCQVKTEVHSMTCSFEDHVRRASEIIEKNVRKLRRIRSIDNNFEAM